MRRGTKISLAALTVLVAVVLISVFRNDTEPQTTKEREAWSAITRANDRLVIDVSALKPVNQFGETKCIYTPPNIVREFETEQRLHIAVVNELRESVKSNGWVVWEGNQNVFEYTETGIPLELIIIDEAKQDPSIRAVSVRISTAEQHATCVGSP